MTSRRAEMTATVVLDARGRLVLTCLTLSRSQMVEGGKRDGLLLHRTNDLMTRMRMIQTPLLPPCFLMSSGTHFPETEATG